MTTFPPVNLHWFSYGKLPIIPSLLSSVELHRSEQLALPLQERFLKTRTMLRLLLANYLHLPPQAIPLALGRKGKPIVVDNVLHFNLSHSHEWVVYVFCTQLPLGIDVEYIRSRNFSRLALRYFLPQEARWIGAQEIATQGISFYRSWVCKEAFSKMLGSSLYEGLLLDTTPLITDQVSLLGKEGAMVTEVAAPPGYRSALSWSFNPDHSHDPM